MGPNGTPSEAPWGHRESGNRKKISREPFSIKPSAWGLNLLSLKRGAHTSCTPDPHICIISRLAFVPTVASSSRSRFSSWTQSYSFAARSPAIHCVPGRLRRSLDARVTFGLAQGPRRTSRRNAKPKVQRQKNRKNEKKGTQKWNVSSGL